MNLLAQVQSAGTNPLVKIAAFIILVASVTQPNKLLGIIGMGISSWLEFSSGELDCGHCYEKCKIYAPA